MSFLDFLTQIDDYSRWGIIIISTFLISIVLTYLGMGVLAVFGIFGLIIILSLTDLLPLWVIPMAIAAMAFLLIFRRQDSGI